MSEPTINFLKRRPLHPIPLPHGESGQDPDEMAVPDERADGEMLNEGHGVFFVEYLRLAFRFGGFPGDEGLIATCQTRFRANVRAKIFLPTFCKKHFLNCLYFAALLRVSRCFVEGNWLLLSLVNEYVGRREVMQVSTLCAPLRRPDDTLFTRGLTE